MNKTDKGRARSGQDQTEEPTLMAWLAALSAIGVIAANLLLPRGGNAYLRGAGAAVLLLGAVFAFLPFFQLRRHGRADHGPNYMATKIVADRGLYAVVRHPQYLGYMVLTCGFGLLSQHWAALVLAASAVALLYLQAVLEERDCLNRLREHYAEYVQRVPRFNLLLGLARQVRRSH